MTPRAGDTHQAGSSRDGAGVSGGRSEWRRRRGRPRELWKRSPVRRRLRPPIGRWPGPRRIRRRPLTPAEEAAAGPGARTVVAQPRHEEEDTGSGGGSDPGLLAGNAGVDEQDRRLGRRRLGRPLWLRPEQLGRERIQLELRSRRSPLQRWQAAPDRDLLPQVVGRRTKKTPPATAALLVTRRGPARSRPRYRLRQSRFCGVTLMKFGPGCADHLRRARRFRSDARGSGQKDEATAHSRPVAAIGRAQARSPVHRCHAGLTALRSERGSR